MCSYIQQYASSQWLKLRLVSPQQSEATANETEFIHENTTSTSFVHENATSTVQLLQIFNLLAAKHAHWHFQWCSHGRNHWESPKH